VIVIVRQIRLENQECLVIFVNRMSCVLVLIMLTTIAIAFFISSYALAKCCIPPFLLKKNEDLRYNALVAPIK